MLNKAERNYCFTWQELLAIVRTMEHFHKYLYGKNSTCARTTLRWSGDSWVLRT
jgi:hypothetical protein